MPIRQAFFPSTRPWRTRLGVALPPASSEGFVQCREILHLRGSERDELLPRRKEMLLLVGAGEGVTLLPREFASTSQGQAVYRRLADALAPLAFELRAVRRKDERNPAVLDLLSLPWRGQGAHRA